MGMTKKFLTSLFLLTLLVFIKTTTSANFLPSPEEPSPTKTINVMVVAYIPPETISSLYPEAKITDPVTFTQTRLIPAMNEASRYHGYALPPKVAPPALNYHVSREAIFVENTPPVYTTTIPTKYDYTYLFNKYNLCQYAKDNNIGAVFLWAAGSGSYEGKMAESAITGSSQPTNGPRLSQLCDKTIVVYGFSYERGLAEALESYGHHLEEVFKWFRPEYIDWSDYGANVNSGLVGQGDSCGSVHNPPNARCEYDRSNPSGYKECGNANAPAQVLSDCRNWKPTGEKKLELLDCTFWNCSTQTGEIDDDARWIIWWMQNMPGLNNGLIGKDSQPIPSWWNYIAEPDAQAVIYRNLQSILVPGKATFEFTSNAPVGSSFQVEASTSPTFVNSQTNWLFAYGPSSPITTDMPEQRLSGYTCGATIYWRVVGGKDRVIGKSPIMTGVVRCKKEPIQCLGLLPCQDTE
jgi:hypothetical protein